MEEMPMEVPDQSPAKSRQVDQLPGPPTQLEEVPLPKVPTNLVEELL